LIDFSKKYADSTGTNIISSWFRFLSLSRWVTEAVPLPVTALLPLVLLPFTGVAPAGLISSAYFSDPILLFFGSFLLAAAVWIQNSHIPLMHSILEIHDWQNLLHSHPRLLLTFEVYN